MLTLSCPDRPGIVRAVAAYLYDAGGNILDSQQYADRTADRFFMRVHCGQTLDLAAGLRLQPEAVGGRASPSGPALCGRVWFGRE